jgi:hypothetical protein
VANRLFAEKTYTFEAAAAPGAQGLVDLRLPKLVIDPAESTLLRATLEAMGAARL